MHTIFLSLLNITKEDLRIIVEENHILLKNLRKKNQNKQKVRGRGQSTLPAKIKKKLINVIQSYKFRPEASLLVEEYGMYKELGLRQQDVTDFLGNCWLSDIHIHQVFQ